MSPEAVALHICGDPLLPLHHLRAYMYFFRIMFAKDSILRDESKGFCDHQDLRYVRCITYLSRVKITTRVSFKGKKEEYIKSRFLMQLSSKQCVRLHSLDNN